jgi:hypothetical protein
VPTKYATEQREIRRPSDGWLQQSAWILPVSQDADNVMRSVAKTVRRCAFSRTTRDPFQPRQHVSSASSFDIATRHGWDGYEVTQVMGLNGERTSVSTRLLVHRDQVILALEYCNYRGGSERDLFAYNQTILDKILARSP